MSLTQWRLPAPQPPVIGRLDSLEELWLDCNALSRLPPEIGKLHHLKCLDVSENRLEALPSEICNLKSLSDLLLSQNCVKKLPKDMGRLVKLVSSARNAVARIARLRLIVSRVGDASRRSLGVGRCSAASTHCEMSAHCGKATADGMIGRRAQKLRY